MIVVAYGQILKKNVLDIPKLGIYNVHASLLPKLRGASPIQHAILEGDERAGVTIMKVDEGLDTGDMLISDSVEIGRMNFEELHDALSELGAELMSKALKLIESGDAVFTKQNDEESTYAGMIMKQDGRIDFDDSAEAIDRKIRAFDPWPGAFCELDGKTVKSARRGKGTIAWGLSMDEAFAMRGVETDLLHDGRSHLIHAHRTMPNAEIYFVACFGGKPAPSVDVSFRVSGRVPELWDAATGEMREADTWRFENGRTLVNLSLARHGSVFVVFAKDAAGRTGNAAVPAKAPIEIAGPWTLEFQSDALHRGPSRPLKTSRLFDLSTSEDSAVKHYSGRITYRTKFRCGKPGARVVLDLGDVAVTAKVKVNGKYAGGVCFEPYRLDVTKFVHEGMNELEVEVCDLWINRLVGDNDVAKRPTWTSIPCCGKGTKLVKSGLVGPVRLIME